MHISPIPDDVDLNPFYVGARLLGLNKVGPQQLELAALMLAEVGDAPLYESLAVTEPRRASKTTTIWAVLLGLCATRPGFQVVVTAQTYVKARARFLEVYRVLARNNVGDYVMKRGAAEMEIQWRTGSRLWVVTPEGQAFRGDGCDRVLFDEAQEHDVEATADLLGGALALMDTGFDDDVDLTDENTRGRGQLIVTGTAGKFRAGMLWDYLERGRRGSVGILEYAVPDGTPVAFLVDSPEGAVGLDAGWGVSADERWVLNEPAVIAAHPGIGTLTTLRVIRDRFQALELPQFAREYGGQWPFDIGTRAINPDDWDACRLDPWPNPEPARFALGYDIAPDASYAALVAAWRDEDGLPWVEVVKHNYRDSWLAKEILVWSTKRVGQRVGFDNIHAGNVAVADRLSTLRKNKPRLVPLATAQITAAAAQLAQEITEHRLRFKVDPALESAVDVATRRNIGDASWAWGRRRSGGDISALVAATNALKVFDLDTRPANRVGMVTSKRATS